MMKNKVSVLVAILALILASLACSLGDTEMSLTNLRMAFDEDGANPTTTFSTSDLFYAVADLKNAPAGTVVKARWLASNIEGYEANELIYEQDLNDFTEETFTGTIYFQLSNDSPWPLGEYKIELYLNGTLAQSAVFSVR